MDEQTQRLIEQLKNNPSAIQSLIQSDDGQNLLKMLTKEDGGSSLQHAAMNAVKGNPNEMMRMLNRIMQSPEGSALVDRINKAVQK